eukprot:Nitzschia sp. Nitz4//scaffold186_size43309//14879//16486//NITZ4_007318-RA/size43309-processed-gene-0.1-mRNA-1//1//CDS//3329539761//1989//frame0
MKLLLGNILLLLGVTYNDAFVNPALVATRTLHLPFPENARIASRIPLPRHLAPDVVSVTVVDKKTAPKPFHPSTKKLLKSTIIVSTITTMVGFLYHEVMMMSTKFIWKKLPTLFSAWSGQKVNPVLFVPAMVTLGGFISAILAILYPTAYSAYDFVYNFSKSPAKSVPSIKGHLLPGLIMGLVAIAFGFSKDPEAPMLCAGSLIGTAVSRRMYGTDENDIEREDRETALGFVGVAGTLTGSMGLPITGTLFPMEMTSSDVGMTRSMEWALSPAIVANVAAMIVLGVVHPSLVGGHFRYGTVGSIGSRLLLSTSLLCGVGGALIGTAFHKLVHAMKHILWHEPKKQWRRELVVKTFVGLAVGCLGVLYPQSMFWGEASLQAVVDGQQTAFTSTFKGIPQFISSHMAMVDPSVPFQAWPAAQVGLAKFLAVSLATAGKITGGIVFPLFFAAAPFAHALSGFMAPGVLPVAVMALMAATQASATRTPLASTLILGLMASAGSELSILMPASLIASYVSVYVSRMLSGESYFHYSSENA